MKYENKEQIKNLLLRASSVYIDSNLNTVYFVGTTLERCEIKVTTHILVDIYDVCKLLEINHQII